MTAEAIFKPNLSPSTLVARARALQGVCFTCTGMRDAGQSDYKNRMRIRDLHGLAPHYNRMGLFSAECHGGARWHVGIMNRMENPFEEIALLREAMPDVLLQTLVRETNLWGYRPYPRNIISYVVSQVDVDVWRCFSFLNDIDNMRLLAEGVMTRGRIFQPALSFTQADWATDAYYLGLTRRIVDLCGGIDEIILCIKDMAGVGSPRRIYTLIDAIKQAFPDLVIQYHRHITDGLALPALLAAAQAGAKILDVEEDSLVRFYGQAPILGVHAYLQENGIAVNLNREQAELAVQKVREWIGDYEWAESPFKGYDHTVVQHRMPGGAFPSSFEQAQKGGFLHLMPSILKVMALYNRIVHYFDVTPGSQITWVVCSGMVNRHYKEKGMAGVEELIRLLTRFVVDKKQHFEDMDDMDRQQLLNLFTDAPGDFQNLLLGKYGKLPVGWPADWVYRSAFGAQWQEKIQERGREAPLDLLGDEDLDQLRRQLAEAIDRQPSEEEFIIYLMHPQDTVKYLQFVEDYGESSLALPTQVWRNGLLRPGDRVAFELWGKPYTIELVSIGAESDGVIHVVLRINKKVHVYAIDTPGSKKEPVRMARGANQMGAPIRGSVWRIGNRQRGPIQEGDMVRKGEEMANLEAMKMETSILAPYDAKVVEVAVKLNDLLEEGQLLFVLERTEAVR